MWVTCPTAQSSSRGAIVTAALSLVVAYLAHRALFVPAHERLTEHSKLAELVPSSLLAFTVFVLALVLTDVRANLGKAADTVLRGASTLGRLDRELQSISDEVATSERRRLREYATGVVTLDWPELAKPEPNLSHDVSDTMALLFREVRAVAASHPEVAGTLGTLLDKLDDFRRSRLESATRTIPPIFWWLVCVFLLGAMVLNGRHQLDAASVALITLHMAAIGLVMAFILVVDEPFRGESTIAPDAILHALPALPAG